MAIVLVTALALFFNKTRIGRALRAVADDHQAALSVGISLNQIWVIVWFAAGIVALATGIMWGAEVGRVLSRWQIVALKALPVLIIGGFTSIPGAIIGGLVIGFGEKLFEFTGAVCLAVVSRLVCICDCTDLPAVPAAGLFGEKIIERI